MGIDNYSIKFYDNFNYNYHQDITAIKLAKDVKPFFKEYQMNKYEKFLFAGCPGMYDLAKFGYIIPAWNDFTIKANKAGIFVDTGFPLGGVRNVNLNVLKMNADVVDGVFHTDNKLEVLKFPSPWRIETSKNVSAFIFPAFFHSPFLDDLYVYPGIVDYDTFPTVNFICSAKRSCEIKVKVGTPLLHVVPFPRVKIDGHMMLTDVKTEGRLNSKFWSSVRSFYRKVLRSDKVFTLTKK
ncbi:hypothetical protein EB118_15945 [bacterium]|nr:hypothetical protein [bacterium]